MAGEITLANLVVKLQANTAELASDLNRVEKRLDKTAKRSINLQKSLAVMAGAAGAAFAAKKMFDLGAAVEETGSKFRTVFGAATKDAQAFIDSFATMAGLSAVEAQEVLATTGAIVQGMGFAQDASAEFAEEVVRLAGDFASFNNIPIAETARAVQSALTGERESLKRLGVVILETDVQQRALAMSGKESAKALTQQEKATATLQLITERAGVAVGDLARTQDSAANRARALAAEFRTIREELATTVMPAFVELMGLVEDSMPTIRRWAETVKGAVSDLRDAIDLAGVLKGEALAGLEGADLDELKAKAKGLAEQIRRLKDLLSEQAVSIGGKDVLLSKDADATAKSIKALQDALRDVNGRIRTYGEETERAASETETQTQALEAQAEAAEEAAEALQQLNDALRQAVTGTGPAPRWAPTEEELERIREARRIASQFTITAQTDAPVGFDPTTGSVGADFSELIEEVDRVSRSAVGLADNLGFLEGAARDAARGISDIIGGIAQGGFGGAVSIIGGVVGALGGLTDTGPSKAEQLLEEQLKLARERNRILGSNEKSLEGLRRRVLGDQGLRESELTRITAQTDTSLLAGLMEGDAGLTASVEQLSRETGIRFRDDAGNIIVGAMDDIIEAAELWRMELQKLQEQFNESIEVRRLQALGLNEEAEALQRQIENERELAEARAQGFDDATIAALEHVQALEAEARAQAEAAETARRVADFHTQLAAGRAGQGTTTEALILGEARIREQVRAWEDLAEAGDITAAEFAELEGILRDRLHQTVAEMRVREALRVRTDALALAEREAALAGDERLALEKQLQRQAEEELAQLRLRLMAGEVTEEHFRRMTAVIRGEVNQALEEFERQAREAAEAERFRQMMDKQGIRVQILRLKGLHDEAQALANQIELQQAVNEGRDAEFLALLRQRQALEAQREAVDETTRAIDGMTRALNAPAGFRLSLLRHQATDPALGGGRAGGGFPTFNTGGGGGGGITIQGDVVIRAAPGQDGAQLFREFKREAERDARAGGVGLLLSEN